MQALATENHQAETAFLLKSTDPHRDSDPAYEVNEAKIDIRAFWTALELFHAREGRYPTDSEGLGALVPMYLRSVPGDPWTRAYIYRNDHAVLPSLYSSGPNGVDQHGEFQSHVPGTKTGLFGGTG